MIVTIIMILTDWLMVGVTKLVYSCKVAYRQGMLFGVHVPGDAAELPEVKTMIEKYQSWMKAFYRWHFAIGTVICFLGMWYMSIFFIAWTVWMTAFFIGVMGKVWQTHRYMYELKMQKGWYEATSEEEQVTSAVDTKTAARTAQMAVPMICHALPLIVLCTQALTSASDTLPLSIRPFSTFAPGTIFFTPSSVLPRPLPPDVAKRIILLPVKS